MTYDYWLTYFLDQFAVGNANSGRVRLILHREQPSIPATPTERQRTVDQRRETDPLEKTSVKKTPQKYDSDELWVKMEVDTKNHRRLNPRHTASDELSYAITRVWPV